MSRSRDLGLQEPAPASPPWPARKGPAPQCDLPAAAAAHEVQPASADTCSTHASASDVGEDDPDEHIQSLCFASGARPCTQEATAEAGQESQPASLPVVRVDGVSRPCHSTTGTTGSPPKRPLPSWLLAFEEVCGEEDHSPLCQRDLLQKSEFKVFSKVSEQPLAPLQALPVQRRCKQRPPEAARMGEGLRVAVMVSGSRGDLQPLIALSRQLVLFRHTVRILTSVNLVDLCAEHGLNAVPAFADSQAAITSLGGMKGFLDCLTDGGQACKDWLAEHEAACISPEAALAQFEPEAIIAGPLTVGIAYRYEAETGVPAMPVWLSCQNFEVFQDLAAVKPVRPALLASSIHLEEMRTDAVPNLQQTGEWVIYQVPSEQDLVDGGRLAELRRFLGTGPAPVAVGWGSMMAFGMTPAEMLRLALCALRAEGYRGVILGGWAELDKLAGRLCSGSLEGLGSDAAGLAAFAAREVCFVNSAPHEWLFPQCRAVVHHGGAGTWHAAIRAGKPSVITPIFGDQFRHARVAEHLGVAVCFTKPLPGVGTAELASAIRRAEGKAAATEALGRKLRCQVGEREGAEVIDAFLQEEVRSSRWRRARDALAVRRGPRAFRCRQ